MESESLKQKETYIQQAKRTENKDYQSSSERLGNLARLLHGLIGIATESGELLDQVKRHVFYGKDLDITNIEEELGDIHWYVAIATDAIGSDEERVKKINIDKLKARYPDKFSNDSAITRNIEHERKVMENSLAEGRAQRVYEKVTGLKWSALPHNAREVYTREAL